MDWWEKPDEVIASIQTAIVQGMKAPKPVVVQENKKRRRKGAGKADAAKVRIHKPLSYLLYKIIIVLK